MVPTFVIGLREGVEAALIVGIIAAFVRQQGRGDALRWVWAGVALAVALCAGVGVGLYLLQETLPQREQERLETIVALLALAFVGWMVVWMRRNARGLRRELEAGAAQALARNTVGALVLMAFLAVLREGFETAVFTVAVFSSAADPVAAGGGVVLGLAAAVVLGVALYRGGVRINLSRFFRATGVVLALVAAGLAAAALHTAHEAGWFDGLQGMAVDLSWLIAPGTVRAALITGMLGLQPKPTVGEAAVWLLVALPMLGFVLWPVGRAGATPRLRDPRGLLRRLATALTTVLLVLVVASCGTNSDVAGNADGATIVELSLTDAGCDPASVTIAAGATTFRVTNAGAGAVTELEVMRGEGILGEVENLTPGLSGTFSLTLDPGVYTLYCPNGDGAERGTLTVTGDATGDGQTTPAVQLAIDSYRDYLIAQAGVLVQRTEEFAAAIEAGDVEEAKLRYAWARESYERIEPVAESFGDLDPAIDAREGDVPTAEWGGFHRIEKALWVDGSLDGMAPVAAALLEDVRQLETLVSDAPLEPARIANGAVELLNEVSASKITGEEERYSHTDLADFKGNLDGARAAFDALRPLLAASDPELADQIARQLDAVDAALEPYRDGSGYVPYTELTAEDTRALSQVVDALAEPMSRVAERVVVAES